MAVCCLLYGKFHGCGDPWLYRPWRCCIHYTQELGMCSLTLVVPALPSSIPASCDPWYLGFVQSLGKCVQPGDLCFPHSPGSALPRVPACPAGQQPLEHDLDFCDITIHLLLGSFGNLRCRISICFAYDSTPLTGLISPSCWLEARLRFDQGPSVHSKLREGLSLLGRKSLLLGQWVGHSKRCPKLQGWATKSSGPSLFHLHPHSGPVLCPPPAWLDQINTREALTRLLHLALQQLIKSRLRASKGACKLQQDRAHTAQSKIFVVFFP